MFAYEVHNPDGRTLFTTSAMKADAVACGLVNTRQTPARVCIYWCQVDGTVAEIGADYGIPADLDSPGLIARMRRQHENQLRARMIRGQLPLPEVAAA
jgi:hypothetical protein